MLFFKNEQFDRMLNESVDLFSGSELLAEGVEALPSYITPDAQGMQIILSETQEDFDNIDSAMMDLNEMVVEKIVEGVDLDTLEPIQENAVTDAMARMGTSIKNMYKKTMAWLKKVFDTLMATFTKGEKSIDALIKHIEPSKLKDFKYSVKNWKKESKITAIGNACLADMEGALKNQEAGSQSQEFKRVATKEYIKTLYLNKDEAEEHVGVPPVNEYAKIIKEFAGGKGIREFQKETGKIYNKAIKDCKELAKKAIVKNSKEDDKDTKAANKESNKNSASVSKANIVYIRKSLSEFNKAMSICISFEKARAAEYMSVIRKAAWAKAPKKKED